MYQSCVNYSSTMTHQYVPTSSTIHLMYVATHQLLVSTMYPTCTSTKSPHQFHHPNLICKFLIDLLYMITYLVEFWIILERKHVERAPHGIFVVWIWKFYIEYYKLYYNPHFFSYLIWICYEEVMTFLPETPILD